MTNDPLPRIPGSCPAARRSRSAQGRPAARPRWTPGAGLWTAILACLVLAGCGYTAKDIFPDEYATIAVPMFENRTFYRGVEMELSEALVKELELRTPYTVVNRAAAGTALEGTITSVDQALVSRRASGGLPQEVEVIVTIDFRWTDLRTGEPIRDRQGFEAVGRYIPAHPVGQPFDVAQHAAVEQLARDVVSVMQSNW